MNLASFLNTQQQIFLCHRPLPLPTCRKFCGIWLNSDDDRQATEDAGFCLVAGSGALPCAQDLTHKSCRLDLDTFETTTLFLFLLAFSVGQIHTRWCHWHYLLGSVLCYGLHGSVLCETKSLWDCWGRGGSTYATLKEALVHTNSSSVGVHL